MILDFNRVDGYHSAANDLPGGGSVITCVLYSIMKPALLCFFLIALSFSEVPQAAEISVSQRFEEFTKLLKKADVAQSISQKRLHAFPMELLTFDSQYPLLNKYSWDDIQTLMEVRQSCRWQDTGNPSLQTAVDFEWALCKGHLLADGWWRNRTLLHPAGGSFGDRYLKALINQWGKSSKEVQNFLQNQGDMLSLCNPYHPLHKIFVSLDDDGLKALLTGYHFFMSSDLSLWISYHQKIVRIKPGIWQPLAHLKGLHISRRGSEQFCPVSYGNLCVTDTELPAYLGWGAAAICFILAVLAVGRGVWQRQQATREKKFILQLLTHELRTPIASLNMTVEQFRMDYDQLSDSGQRAFTRLLQDSSRLHRLTETSKGFLSNDSQSMLQSQPAMVSEWLEDVVDKYAITYKIPADKELSLPWYWLGLCLDNLIRNALTHGTPPVTLMVGTEPVLRLEVMDQGQSPGRFQDIFGQQRVETRGMGIGLLLVKRIMKRLGGRLIHQRNPTRYILELDYDKTATG